MKRKIIIGITTLTLIFLMSGLYIIVSIERTTSMLNKLFTMHQVEILRENLLLEIKMVQTDLNLHNTRHARGVDVLVSHVTNMEQNVDKCFGCHHSEALKQRLSELKDETQEYKNALSRVFTIRANVKRIEAEEDRAFELGERLITKASNMVFLHKQLLEQRTSAAVTGINKTKTVLFLLIILGPLMTIILAAMFIRSLTKPVNLLLDATRKLKAGHLDHRVEGLTDEFGEVARSFNEMAHSIQEQMLVMQRTDQLVTCGEMATRLAHEIKNPLAGIKISMQVLSSESDMSDEDKDILGKVIDEVHRIEQLMKSLLNFARPPKPAFVNVDLSEVLDKTLSFLHKYTSYSLADPNKIEIVKDFDHHIPEITADPMQLQQIFLNLFLNAAEAMPQGGSLNVRASYDASGSTIQVEVSDTGKGINDNVKDKLFQPFFTTKSKGTGLGLAITKQLAEQHSGSIHVSNNPEGGATFTVILPLKRVEQDEEPAKA